jgi:type II secretory pathway pseudopilin PulG
MLVTRKLIARRPGFTLVELMVSAALAITIMWILSEAFKVGIDFARNAHSTGDMMSQLNNTGQIMTRDLQAQRFGTAGAMRNPNSGTGNAMPDTLNALSPSTNMTAAPGYTPPSGYFRLFSPPPSGTYQQSGLDFADDTTGLSITTTNATGPSAPGAYLAFTSFLPQGLPQNQFITTAPPNSQNQYFSRAAEIAYFIGGGINPNTGQPSLGLPTGFTAPVVVTSSLQAQQPLLSTTSGPQPLYNLYRSQRLIAVKSDESKRFHNVITPATPPNPLFDPNAQDVISYTVIPPASPTQSPTYHQNVLSDFGTTFSTSSGPMPATSFRYSPNMTNGISQLLQPLTTPGRVGDDILLSNVLSFEVLASWVPAPGPGTGSVPFLSYPSKTAPFSQMPVRFPRPFTNPPSNPNTDYPFDHLPNVNFNSNVPAHTFDTWYQVTQPYPTATGNPNVNWNWNNYYILYNPQLKLTANPNLMPMPIRITGLQITIRIYDPKTNQARQNTWRIAM